MHWCPVPVKDTFVAEGVCRVAFEGHPLPLGEIIDTDIANSVPVHLGKNQKMPESIVTLSSQKPFRPRI